jgi:hypothetical protein
MNLTRIVYKKYEYYLGIELTGDNLQSFQNGVNYQMKAIDELKNSNDVYGYIYWMDKASESYDNIILGD